MHSSTETAGAKDYPEMVKVLKHYYESALESKGDTIKIIGK
jgi:aspartyl aminopeptidase